MKKESTIKINRRLSGEVVSNKMAKTAVVLVSGVKTHPLYGKKIKVSDKYKIHDPKGECKIGDKVVFEACRPLSRDKRWRLIEIIKK
jgi:small subunit ribosomal protein S17